MLPSLKRSIQDQTKANNENQTHNLGTPWTPEEKEALIKGVEELGKEWAKILEKYNDIFSVNARTNRNLMDKWRNMEVARMNKVLGFFVEVIGLVQGISILGRLFVLKWHCMLNAFRPHFLKFFHN